MGLKPGIGTCYLKRDNIHCALWQFFSAVSKHNVILEGRKKNEPVSIGTVTWNLLFERKWDESYNNLNSCKWTDSHLDFFSHSYITTDDLTFFLSFFFSFFLSFFLSLLVRLTFCLSFFAFASNFLYFLLYLFVIVSSLVVAFDIATHFLFSSSCSLCITKYFTFLR
jgi:hypothetical protein